MFAPFSEDEQTDLGLAAASIAHTELGLSAFSSVDPAKVKDAIIDDAQKMGGDTSYKIDIGV